MKKQHYVIKLTIPHTDAFSAMETLANDLDSALDTNLSLTLRQYVEERIMSGDIVNVNEPSLAEDKCTLTIERIWRDADVTEFLNMMSLNDIQTTLSSLPHIEELLEYAFIEHSVD
jgi:hypothetical protein